MNTYSKTITAAVTAFTLLLSSCNDILDTKPYQQLPAASAITDATSANAALLGAYSNVQNYYSLNYPTLGFLPADNVRFNGTLNQFLQTDQNALTPDNVIITGTWTTIYQAINSANTIIDVVPGLTDPVLTASEKNKITGEAYFIRALGYFDLGRGWGGVPLVLKPTKTISDAQGIRRSSLPQTYDQVLADLTKAEELLPEAATRNRAVKKTAQALRARLHLYREQWVDAEAFASTVIGNSSYALVTPYKAFFTAPFLTNESVFELTFSNADPNTIWNNWYPSALGGQYNFQPTTDFIATLNARGGNRSSLLASVTTGSTTSIYGNLYNRSGLRDDPAYILRIAELYLIRAEARAQQDKLDGADGALADLNAVRQRAGLANSTAATKAEVLLAIEDERRLEFAFEAHRWFDLVRTKRAGDVLGVTDTRKWLFPIPLVDIGADPDLAGDQNPGY
ncbi:RagB/SusD domain-containing protein [Chryseolinea serpens]|uniref:RagB/SusD domain-containing protein n=1 Tax=Chryseolinea serpens TaxID=947013 RepID=A0A1M5XUU4_9BACT|nr:RagB/SusD family nutrient uptake outer membrane protein [Chryseolinea serpens]SHI03033.1 RagB/SusD domain-containing protein [Chryseolinea serpens]